MLVDQVNIGSRRRLQGRLFSGVTGIFKHAAGGRVSVHELGVDDDAVCDARHHGGPDQAVYLYRSEDYVWFSDELDRRVEPGSFGENLTVSGLASPGLAVGTHLVFADLELEVTAPRIPCRTLAQRMDDAGFVKRFLDARRPGIYLRVIRPGTVAAGDSFEVVAPDDVEVSTLVDTLEVFDAVQRRLDSEELRRLLAAPIDIRTRRKLEQSLARQSA